ncbi:MAG TPA: hypothetical protein VEC37_06735 [Bacillota bacterium]|nr:hypothetical protein [Bacillota bacterium]
MKRQIREEYNTAAQECSEYEPIQAAKNLAMSIEDNEIEDAGCDSCIHYNNGECGVYKAGSSAEFNDSDF